MVRAAPHLARRHAQQADGARPAANGCCRSRSTSADGFGPFKGCFKELDPLRGANVFVSNDQGATWERRGAATFPESRLARAHDRRAQGRLALDAGPHGEGHHAKHLDRRRPHLGRADRAARHPPAERPLSHPPPGVRPAPARQARRRDRRARRPRASSAPGSRTTTARPGRAA